MSSSSIAQQIFIAVSFQTTVDIEDFYSDSVQNSDSRTVIVSPVLRSGLDAVNFVSGDVDFVDFQKVLSICNVTSENEIFVDLGCGSGNCLLAAALSHCFNNAESFLQVEGIELKQAKFRECEFLSFRFDQISTKMQVLTPKVVVRHSNFFDVDWSYATVVYACATCFTNLVMGRLIIRFLSLKKGARVILLDKELCMDYFTGSVMKNLRDTEEQLLPIFELTNFFSCLGRVECCTSWGKGVATIYQKL